MHTVQPEHTVAYKYSEADGKLQITNAQVGLPISIPRILDMGKVRGKGAIRRNEIMPGLSF